MTTRRMLGALIAWLTLLCAAPAIAQTPVPVQPSQRFAWDHDGLGTDVFRFCVDAVCTDVPGGKTVRAFVPMLAPGVHTIAVQACRVGPPDLCATSDPLVVDFRATPAKPTRLRLEDIPVGGDGGEQLMAISSATITTFNSSPSQTNGLTQSVIVGAGTDRLMTVWVGTWSSSGGDSVISSVTYGGTPLTSVGSTVSSNGDRLSVYRLIAPAVGTADLVVTPVGFAELMGAASVRTGVDQTTPLGTLVTATGNGASPSLSVSSASGEVVEAAWTGWNAMVSGTGTQLWWVDNGGGINSSHGQDYPGASSVSVSWTAGSFDWSIGGVAIKPASGGGGGTANPWYAFAQL